MGSALLLKRGVAAAAIGIAIATGCARPLRMVPVPMGAELRELWIEPTDIATRDLFHGPRGRELLPDASSRYAFVRKKTTGISPGYDVRDPNGLEWSVKLGVEAQPEVVASRILWAVGYHQPPTYYVRSWILESDGVVSSQPPGRFRPELPDLERAGEWKWHENPFVDARPFRGLIVFMVMLTNWDLKDDNNAVYKVAAPTTGPRHLFVVRDLGASLGKAAFYPQGTKNDLEDFEKQGFVKGVDGDRARIDFNSRRYRGLFRHIAVADVRWACELMSRISDSQLDDAFRAADYAPERRERYIGKLREKMHAGLKLGLGTGAPPARAE